MWKRLKFSRSASGRKILTFNRRTKDPIEDTEDIGFQFNPIKLVTLTHNFAMAKELSRRDAQTAFIQLGFYSAIIPIYYDKKSGMFRVQKNIACYATYNVRFLSHFSGVHRVYPFARNF